MLRRIVVRGVAAASMALIGCDDTPPRAPNACVLDAGGNPSTLLDELTPGSYLPGTIRGSFVDTSRTTPAYGAYAGAASRTLSTTITYPATDEADGASVAAGGPFPVVLYSHGFSSSQGENPRLAKHLASHGYIVVAPAFPLSNIDAPDGPTGIDIANQPGDLSFLLDTLLAPTGTPAEPLAGAADASRVAAVGLSLGGMTTLLVTFHPTLRDPRIDVAAAFAPPTQIFGEAFYATVSTPLMVLHGDADAIVDYDINATSVWERAGAPVSVMRLDRGSHSGFMLLASLFENAAGYEHVDKLACNGLSVTGGGGGDGGFSSIYDLLGGASAGLVLDTRQGNFCPDPLGVSMRPVRQLDLTDAATLSFLDAYLADDPARQGQACDFVERRLPREPDLIRYGR